MDARRSYAGRRLPAALAAAIAALALCSGAVGSTDGRSRPGDSIAVATGGELRVFDARTGTSRQVAVFVESEAAWSPDRRALAYVADGTLRTSQVATGRERTVMRLHGRFSIGPSWSRRGRRLAVTLHGALSDAGALVVVGSDGRHRRVVDHAAASYQVPQWSPDGRKLAYLRGGSNGSEIWLATSRGGARVLERNVLDYPESLAWSPDGRRVAFVGSPTARASDVAVLVASASGSHRRAVSSVAPRREEPTVGSVKWSPTGARIAFLRWGTDGDASLCVAQLGGGERALVPAAPIADFAWSPDGRSVAYATEDPGVLWILRVDGSKRRKVGRLTGELDGIAWG